MPPIKYNYFHWGPFLFHTKISQEECDILIEAGKKCRKSSNDFGHRLAGHLAEQYTLTKFEWLNKYFEAYLIGYEKWRGRKHTSSPFELKSLWINYMKANEFNPPHNHGGDLSFVIYLDVPKEITQENKDFKGTLNGPGGISWLYGEMDIQCINVAQRMPATRDFFIFPAFLKHWVFPFRSDVERVSVSGNIVVKDS
jgi:hypothetical protein